MSVKKSGQKIVMPQFPQITKYIYTEAELRVKDASKRITIGNHTLPFDVSVYVEVNRLVFFCCMHFESVCIQMYGMYFKIVKISSHLF